MCDIELFRNDFRALTGNMPFPWQEEMYARFMRGDLPKSCRLPTGLGKTAIIAIWIIALAHCVESRRDRVRIPRRLVYVVNRRTVVDQSTREAERIRSRLNGEANLSEEDRTVLQGLRRLLAELCTPRDDHVLAISTLRGQFADNQQWSADPSRPAIICGTVDMIGSRLLFGGYRIGFKSRPLHAGFLGQDALLMHDEAHLEPAFQELIERIEQEQEREKQRVIDTPWPKLRVMALSATARNRNEDCQEDECKIFGPTDREKQPPERIPDPPTEPLHHVWRRMKAKKVLATHKVGDAKDAVAKEIVNLAETYKDSNAAVLVYVRTLDDIGIVEKGLQQTRRSVVLLTGTMRGLERDNLVTRDDFRRFLQGGPSDKTVYLVCTSAGEVGIDISADHMVCDLSTFESMAQRFGRVNRYGDGDARIDVVYPDKFDEKDALTPARQATLKLLQELNGNASPLALDGLDSAARLKAFAPTPTILPATDILFDAWAMTTIRGQMPGRPPVGPYLHGVAEWEPARTRVAWRDEVEHITEELLERENEDYPQDLLADYPLKPHELLSETTEHVYKALEAFVAEPKSAAKLAPEQRRQRLTRVRENRSAAVWLVQDNGTLTRTTLGDLMRADKKASSAEFVGEFWFREVSEGVI